MATELKFECEAVNLEVLEAELMASIGEGYGGVTIGGGVVRVHLVDGVEADEVAGWVAQVVEAHKPEQLSEKQRAEAAWQAELSRLRALPWGEWTADDRELLLRWVAVRMGALPETERV